MNRHEAGQDRSPQRRFGRRFGTVLILCLVLATPAALAEAAKDPTSAQYENTVTGVSNDVGGGDGGGNRPAESSESSLQRTFVDVLPFTGLDLIVLVAVAVALMSVGLTLRWLTTTRQPSV
jgi:hypothetical protein